MTMDPWQEVNWFAIHAKACRESFAADNINALGTQVFLPRIREERFIGRGRRTITRPLFAGYLFARFSPRKMLISVRHARGVLAVLSTGRFPIPVADDIIAGIRSRLCEDGYARISKPELSCGRRVRIEDGPLRGWIGQVQMECDDGKRVALLLEAIDRARVLVEKRWLAPVDAGILN